MLFFRIVQHLLPRGRAFKVTKVTKRIREFLYGIVQGIGPAFKDFIDQIFLDIFPATTTQLSEWEAQLGLMNTGLSEAARRTRLEGTWSALGGQDPFYIQETLRNSGFDVYVHEAWELPRPEPSGTPIFRNPLLYLRSDATVITYIVECGEALAECGEALAECGESLDPQGYVLVNKIVFSEPDFVVACGESDAECGEPEAEAGNYVGFVFSPVVYPIPADPNTYPYYLYIGGTNFGELATVDSNRRDEFEDLALKIAPTHVWLGMLVNYS